MIWGDLPFEMPGFRSDFYSARADERVYFAFVEDVSILAGDNMEAPDGGLLQPLNTVFENEPVRFRMSGVELHHFLDRLEDFEELEQGQIDVEQQRQRRTALLSFFESAPVPVMDLYASARDDQLARLRRTLLPSTWHVVIFRPGSTTEAVYPIYLGEPYPRFPAEFPSGELRALLPVPRWIEMRLRDIFSLNHVPDAEIDETDEGGSATAPTPPPGDDPGPDMARNRVTINAQAAELEEAEMVPVKPVHRRDEDEQEYVAQRF